MHPFKISMVFALLVSAGVGAANAAESMTGAVRSGRPVTAARMPTMPTLPINSIGNNAVDVDTPNVSDNNGGGGNGGNGGGNNGGGDGNGGKDKPGWPWKPGKPGDDKPGKPTKPDDDGKCRDGGVRDSEYTVDNCMNDILACVNNGALPNGLNDLFNEDLRNSIFNGMNLCAPQVEKCVTTVRVDCDKVYNSPADVWWDFNSRKVQPEYYNFILRKTGLTPNQAENTCWLLDRNTYGSAFNAVANSGSTTREYNIGVGAFNSAQNDTLSKTNPMGARVNTGHTGVDGQRGHYARWDAATGTCLLRVAAYNKDTHITNSWLFGAAGDDRPAEVWRAMGDSFTCNKDMFGFSLMPKTNTAAVAGIGGGTLLGAGIGAIAGHGNRAFDCENNSAVRTLSDELRGTNPAILNEYIMGGSIPATGNITPMQCREIVNLYGLYQQAATAQELCGDNGARLMTSSVDVQLAYTEIGGRYTDVEVIGVPDAYKPGIIAAVESAQPGLAEAQIRAIAMAEFDRQQAIVNENVKCDGRFIRLNQAMVAGDGIYCTSASGCQTYAELQREVARLKPIMDSLQVLRGEESNILPSTLTGAAIGAGTGGLATAITAFIEKNNINCRVGDGLEQVGYGKSHSLGSLKDYYVKWNLRLPDTIMPTAMVTDCDSWKGACGTLLSLEDCKNAWINYKPAKSNSTTLIRGACQSSGSVCIENRSVAKSYRACK